MNKDPILICESLCKSAGPAKDPMHILHHISFRLPAGKGAIITGPSGSGKSTLLHLLGGLDQPTSGKIWIKGHCLHRLSDRKLALLRRQDVGFIYQFHHLLENFTALENVAMPLLLGGISRKLATQRATRMLEQVGLSHRQTHRPSALSGGERQRVAIARALVHQPALVLADEPTGSLDEENAEKCFALLRRLTTEFGQACLMITHDEKRSGSWDFHYRLEQGVLSTHDRRRQESEVCG